LFFLAAKLVNLAKHGAGRHVQNSGNTAEAMRLYGSAANVMWLLRQTVLPQWNDTGLVESKVSGATDNRAATAADVQKVRP
jgi:hypothetical protein